MAPRPLKRTGSDAELREAYNRVAGLRTEIKKVIVGYDEVIEQTIIALLAGGASNAKIAETLFVTPNTVRTHLDRIRDKTGARNRAELTRYAIQAGIEPVDPSP